MKILLIFLVVILAVAMGPLVTIWALNSLFPALAIPYTFSTWLAVIIVGAVLQARVEVKK
jgi:ribosomal protein RSM22 (predicted rRNA methylase)